MVDENKQTGNVFSADDPLDINELASLNDDISPEFIEQLQNKVSLNAQEFTGKPVTLDKDDSELFEEVNQESSDNNFDSETFKENINDNFVKKYKAKIEKEEHSTESEDEEVNKKITPQQTTTNETSDIEDSSAQTTVQEPAPKTEKNKKKNEKNTEAEKVENIEEISSGNIIEKPIEQEQIDYNESLDYLDDNKKYSKYVIYIEPENKEFIDSLTVKERKNLINKILREQDDIALTKKRLGLIQTIIKHTFIAIITLAVAIPVTYWTINASLEASINNYRRSQTIFKTLYKEKGKIKKQNIH